MIRSISAEFQTIDDAEYAVRAVKDKIDGISRVKIDGFGNNLKNTYNPFGHSAFINGNTNPSASNMYVSNLQFSQFFNEFYGAENPRFSNETELKKSVVVEIHCKNESLNAVSSIITGLGGLNVKKF